MPKTISLHLGSTYSRGHNIRDERYVAEQKHIDKSLSVRNEVIVDEPVREAYERLFGEALREYNEKQARSDRRIEDYYTKVKQDKKKHPVYECIVQIGDKDDTGNLAEKEKEVLRAYAQSWAERNPNLALIGAYLHADEPNGTVHLHCDFVPVAECSRGMKLQNGLAKALEQQGLKGSKATATAQMQWQERERAVIEKLAQSYGVDARANQGLTHAHLSVGEYQREKDKIVGQLEAERDTLRAENGTLTADKDNLTSEVKALSKRTTELSRGIVDSERKIDKLNKQIDSLKASRLSYEQLKASRTGKSLLGKPKDYVKVPYDEYETLRERALIYEKIEAEKQKITALRSENERLKAQLTIHEQQARSDRAEARALYQKVQRLSDRQEIEIYNKARDFLDRSFDGVQLGSRAERLEQFCSKLYCENGTSVLDEFNKAENSLHEKAKTALDMTRRRNRGLSR